MAKRLDITDNQVMDMAARYRAGTPLRELADEKNCSVPSISRRLRQVGVEIRRPGRRSSEEEVQAITGDYAATEPVVVEEPELVTPEPEVEPAPVVDEKAKAWNW